MLKVPALIIFACLLAVIYRRVRPSKFGLAFGLFLLYVPVNFKLPLSVMPLVNGLMGFLVLLIALRPREGRVGTSGGSWKALSLGFLALSTIGAVISLAAGEPVGETAMALMRWIVPVLFGLLALSLTRPEDRRFAVICIAFGFAIVGLQALKEGFSYGAKRRILGLLSQPNMTGSFIAMYAPVTVALACIALKGIPRLALLGALAIAGWGLMYTDSRASMIAFGVAFVALLSGGRRPLLAATALGLFGLIWLYPEILPERVSARFAETRVDERVVAPVPTSTVGAGYEASAANRLQNWHAAAIAISRNPFGYGLDRFKGLIGGFGGIDGLDAHNVFLLLAFELGVPALLLALLLFGKILLDGRAVARLAADPWTRALGVGVFAMAAPAVVVNCFGSRLFEEAPSTYLWVLGGMIAGTRDLMRAKPPGPWAAPPPARAATARTGPRSRLDVLRGRARGPARQVVAGLGGARGRYRP